MITTLKDLRAFVERTAHLSDSAPTFVGLRPLDRPDDERRTAMLFVEAIETDQEVESDAIDLVDQELWRTVHWKDRDGHPQKIAFDTHAQAARFALELTDNGPQAVRRDDGEVRILPE